MAAEPLKTLTLESSIAQEAEAVDALPYIDGITAEERRQAEELIKEELKHSTKKPSDYLASFAPMPKSSFQGHPLLQHEIERVKAGKPMDPLDTSRFLLNPPATNKQNDFAAWRKVTDNAHSQLEHQYNRLTNLELLLRFGPNARRVHIKSLEGHIARLKAEVEQLQQKKDSINRQRKLSQTADGQALQHMEQEYRMLISKNLDIDAACQALQREVLQLQPQRANSDESSHDTLKDTDAMEVTS